MSLEGQLFRGYDLGGRRAFRLERLLSLLEFFLTEEREREHTVSRVEFRLIYAEGERGLK